MNFIRNYSYIIFLFLIAVVSVAILPGKEDNELLHTAEIRVDHGDTLFALHREAGTSLPADRWIEEVLELNGKKDGTILAGETLLVPVKANYSDDIQLAGEEE